MKLPNLGGRYSLGDSLGAGGMGEVYLAYDQQLARRVAIKRLTPRHEGRERRRERFRREARIAAQLDHPAVVRVYDVVENRDTDYIIMEYVDGATLHARIRERAPLSLAQVLRLGRQIAAGMAAAHERDIIHRDLKSENVLVDGAGNAKVTDFGIAKMLGDESLTDDGLVLGTYKAMSPEQARGANVDLRTDLFSFGILLYEALAGTPPFTGQTSSEIVEAILRSEPPPLAERRPDLPPALNNLIGQLLQKSRDLRPAGGFVAVGATLEEIAADVGADLIDEIGEPGAGEIALGGETRSIENPTPGTPAQAREAAAEPDAPVQQVTAMQRPADTGNHRSRPQPRRRSRAFFGLGALVLAVVVYALAPWRTIQVPDDRNRIPAPAPAPHYIAVDEPRLLDCTDADMEQIRTVRHAINGALIALEGVNVLSSAVAPGSGASVATHSDALVIPDEHLSISITCLPGRFGIELQRVAPQGAIIDQSQRFEIERSDIGRSNIAIRTNIQELFSKGGTHASRFLPDVRPDDVERFMRLRQAYWQKDPAFSTKQIIAELGRIRERSPGLVDAYRFEAELWHHQYVKSRDEHDYQQARSLLARARALAPSSQLVLSGIIALALDHGDFEEAEEVLDELEKRSPASGLPLYLRALILDARGHKRAARDLLETAAERQPSWRILYHLAKLEIHLGQIDAARVHLDQLLTMAPDNRTVKAMRTTLALFIDQDMSSCQRKFGLKDAPQIKLINNCGVALLEKGQYTEAALLFERARTIAPEYLEAILNLGETRELAGQPELATPAFRELLRRIEPDTRAPRELMIRALALAHLKREEEARQAIEQAVGHSPNDGAIRYAAAATYAILRDREKTVRWILETPRGDYGPATFRYPWFDFVRDDDPRLSERLAPTGSMNRE